MTDANRWLRVPQLPRPGYEVDIPWSSIEGSLERFAEGCTLRLDPDFQRAHVWSEEQQRAYVEYVLSGGEVGRNITWNCPGWPAGPMGQPLDLVDGKQRLEAVRRFVRGDLEVFGMRFRPGVDRLHVMSVTFRFRVCSLPTRADVLRLYLNINAGGTPHTPDELDHVRALLEEESQR